MDNYKLDRLNLCKSLVGKGSQIVLADNISLDLPNRTVNSNGNTIGYYAVLFKYEEQTDLFNEKIKAKDVQPIAIFDSVRKFIKETKNKLN